MEQYQANIYSPSFLVQSSIRAKLYFIDFAWILFVSLCTKCSFSQLSLSQCTCLRASISSTLYLQNLGSIRWSFPDKLLQTADNHCWFDWTFIVKQGFCYLNVRVENWKGTPGGVGSPIIFLTILFEIDSTKTGEGGQPFTIYRMTHITKMFSRTIEIPQHTQNF